MAIGVGVASTPMMLEGIIYYKLFSQSVHSCLMQVANKVMLGLLIAENLSILVATYVSSEENYGNFLINGDTCISKDDNGKC